VAIIIPKFSGLYMNWAYSLFNLGKFKEAVEKYQKVIELAPKNVEAFIGWGQSLRFLKDFLLRH
jgi:tetratricopeptide (TPR) repeat protein